MSTETVDVAQTSPLLVTKVEDELLNRWTDIQISFVEDPRASVLAADALIQEIADTLISALDERRSQLAAGWRDESDTETLRRALWRYRSFISVVLPK
jgi:hypothetical protein